MRRTRNRCPVINRPLEKEVDSEHAAMDLNPQKFERDDELLVAGHHMCSFLSNAIPQSLAA